MPAWAQGTHRGHAYRAGLATLFRTPSLALFGSALGYGAFAQNGGFDLAQTLFIAITVFALPGQIVLVDQYAQGASLAALALSVTLTAIRLLPMSVVLTPYLCGPKGPTWRTFAAMHFLAITSWVEGMRWLPRLAPPMRMPYFAGVISAIATSVLSATIIGFLLADTVPTPVAAALLFVTPIYFLLALLQPALKADLVAIGVGGVIGPLAFMVVPGFELLLAGLIGGTIAFGVHSRSKARHLQRPGADRSG
ncbi:MAG: AzlC family ABC transporter permease [Pseudomonadota bacterium]